jgi:hypothetical protein
VLLQPDAIEYVHPAAGGRAISLLFQDPESAVNNLHQRVI